MNQQKFNKEILVRLERLENAVLGKTQEVTTASGTKSRKINVRSKGENLFPPIEKLLEEGFFNEWRSDVEVCKQLVLRLLTKKKPLRPSVVNVLRAKVKNETLVREKIQKEKRNVLSYKKAQS